MEETKYGSAVAVCVPCTSASYPYTCTSTLSVFRRPVVFSLNCGCLNSRLVILKSSGIIVSGCVDTIFDVPIPYLGNRVVIGELPGFSVNGYDMLICDKWIRIVHESLSSHVNHDVLFSPLSSNCVYLPDKHFLSEDLFFTLSYFWNFFVSAIPIVNAKLNFPFVLRNREKHLSGVSIVSGRELLSSFSNQMLVVFDISGVLAPLGVHMISDDMLLAIDSFLCSIPDVKVVILTSALVSPCDVISAKSKWPDSIAFLNREACFPSSDGAHGTLKGKGMLFPFIHNGVHVFDDTPIKWSSFSPSYEFHFHHVSRPLCPGNIHLISKAIAAGIPFDNDPSCDSSLLSQLPLYPIALRDIQPLVVACPSVSDDIKYISDLNRGYFSDDDLVDNHFNRCVSGSDLSSDNDLASLPLSSSSLSFVSPLVIDITPVDALCVGLACEVSFHFGDDRA